MFPNPDTGHGERPYNDTWDNFGPIYIPSAGSTVELTPKNINAYRRIIGEYEGHDLRITSESKVFIDGIESTNYTFEKDYYWMMGDNRHNSLDARKWGYVPQDHIVGKPVFIWMSYDKHGKGMKKIRTDRVFTTVNGEGKTQELLLVFYRSPWYLSNCTIREKAKEIVMHTLLSTAYFPPIIWVAYAVQSEELRLESQENFQKQSYRSRMDIAGPNGKQTLSVPVDRSIKNILTTPISYQEDWVSKHLKSIETAYANSPFFEVLFPDVEVILKKEYSSLWSLNLATIQLFFHWLESSTKYILLPVMRPYPTSMMRVVCIQRKNWI